MEKGLHKRELGLREGMAGRNSGFFSPLTLRDSPSEFLNWLHHHFCSDPACKQSDPAAQGPAWEEKDGEGGVGWCGVGWGGVGGTHLRMPQLEVCREP